MYIPKAKSGSIVRADFACIQYAQTGIFVMIFDSISERDIPGRAPSWIRIFVICKHENQLRQKIERLSDGNVGINRISRIHLAFCWSAVPSNGVVCRSNCFNRIRCSGVGRAIKKAAVINNTEMEAPISVCLVHIKVAWRKIEPLSDGRIIVRCTITVILTCRIIVRIPINSSQIRWLVSDTSVSAIAKHHAKSCPNIPWKTIVWICKSICVHQPVIAFAVTRKYIVDTWCPRAVAGNHNQFRRKIERLLNRKETVFLAADILLIGYPIASGFLGIPAELRALQIKYQICATWIWMTAVEWLILGCLLCEPQKTRAAWIGVESTQRTGLLDNHQLRHKIERYSVGAETAK